jgi:hypothetical protein
MRLSECFDILGLKGNEDIKKVKSTYRSLLKQKLPKLDSDSEEGRKIIEAFEQIAEHFGVDPSTISGEGSQALKQHIKNLDIQITSLKSQIEAVGGQVLGKSFGHELVDGICAAITENKKLSELKVGIFTRSYSVFSTAKFTKIPTKHDPSSFTIELERRNTETADRIYASAYINTKEGESKIELNAEGRIIKCIPATMAVVVESGDCRTCVGSILETIGKKWKLSSDSLDTAWKLCNEKGIPMIFAEVQDRVEEARLVKEINELKETLNEKQHEVDLLDSAFPSRKKLLSK